MQLFQKIANPPIPIAPDKDIEALQRLHRDRSVRSGKTQDINLILFNPHLNWFPNIVRLMIYRVGEALFYRSIGVVEETVSLRTVRILDDFFLNHTVLNILQSSSQLLMKRSPENLFFNPVSTDAFRELHHINLRTGNILFRLHAEKEQPHILWFHILRHTVGNTHIDT